MINNFANVNIDRVFDSLGIQLYARRPSIPILERGNSGALLYSTVENDGLHITVSGMTREYSGRYYCSTLKSSAIKLYLLLYFYANGNGLTDEIGYDEVSDLLGVHKKTVKAALEKLAEENYIEYYPDRYTFFCTILDYKDMYESRSIRHSGYITLNRELLDGILAISGINSLRCSILAIFKMLRNQFKSASKLPAAEIRMNEFTFNMPKYIRPYIVEKAISDTRAFFSSWKKRYDRFLFVLDKKFQAATIKQQIRAEGKDRIGKLLDGLNTLRQSVVKDFKTTGELSNDTLLKASSYQISEARLISSFNGDSVPEPKFNSDQKNDLLGLCTEYGIDIVLSAIVIYFDQYILTGIKPDNPGGLIRSIIKELISFNRELAI